MKGLDVNYYFQSYVLAYKLKFVTNSY